MHKLSNSFDKIKNIIQESNSVLLSTHENPDCDGLGSEIAIYYYLKSIGKDCKIINCTDMSSKYKFIDPEDIVQLYCSEHDSWLDKIDLAIIFDIGNYKRLAQIHSLIRDCKNKVSIDHHLSAKNSFFNHEIIDVDAPATGYIVWNFLNEVHPEALKDSIVVNALYSAIITDTGSFRYSNTNPETHLIAASLLERGVQPNEIYQNIYENRTKSQIRLLAHVIDKIEYHASGEIACVTLYESDFEACDSNLSENEGMADFVRSIEGVEISFVVTEIDEEKYKISFRSRKKYIINDIAEQFSGGGHALASGATVSTKNPEYLVSQIISLLKERIADVN